MSDRGTDAATVTATTGVDVVGPLPGHAPPSDAARALSCRTVAIAGLQMHHHVRDLPPIRRGGATKGDVPALADDADPHPSEMLLLALGTCLTTSVQANAVARGISLKSLEVHTRGEVDHSALWGTGSRKITPLGFQSISVQVRVEADISLEALRALVDYAVLWSPVANTLHDPVDIAVAIASS